MFDEEDNVAEFYRRVSLALRSIPHVKCRIIFVDDGSNDSTLSRIYSLKTSKSVTIDVIANSRNYGLERSIIYGLQETCNEIAIVLDTDLQDPPELIPKLYSLINDCGFDLVACTRKSRLSDTTFKKTTAWLYYRLLKIVGGNNNFDLDSGNFRALNPELVKAILFSSIKQTPFRFASSSLSKNKRVIEYDRASRHSGKSKYPINVLIKHALDSFFAINNRLISFSIVQFLFSLTYLYFVLSAEYVPAFTSGILVLSHLIFFTNLIMSSTIITYFYRTKFRSSFISLLKTHGARGGFDGK